jgi:hypothetical protein
MEEHRLRVFDNRVIKKLLWLRGRDNKVDKAIYCNRKIHDMISLPNIIRLVNSRSKK